MADIDPRLTPEMQIATARDRVEQLYRERMPLEKQLLQAVEGLKPHTHDGMAGIQAAGENLNHGKFDSKFLPLDALRPDAEGFVHAHDHLHLNALKLDVAPGGAIQKYTGDGPLGPLRRAIQQLEEPQAALVRERRRLEGLCKRAGLDFAALDREIHRSVHQAFHANTPPIGIRAAVAKPAPLAPAVLDLDAFEHLPSLAQENATLAARAELSKTLPARMAHLQEVGEPMFDFMRAQAPAVAEKKGLRGWFGGWFRPAAASSITPAAPLTPYEAPQFTAADAFGAVDHHEIPRFSNFPMPEVLRPIDIFHVTEPFDYGIRVPDTLLPPRPHQPPTLAQLPRHGDDTPLPSFLDPDHPDNTGIMKAAPAVTPPAMESKLVVTPPHGWKPSDSQIIADPLGMIAMRREAVEQARAARLAGGKRGFAAFSKSFAAPAILRGPEATLPRIHRIILGPSSGGRGFGIRARSPYGELLSGPQATSLSIMNHGDVSSLLPGSGEKYRSFPLNDRGQWFLGTAVSPGSISSNNCPWTLGQILQPEHIDYLRGGEDLYKLVELDPLRGQKPSRELAQAFQDKYMSSGRLSETKLIPAYEVADRMAWSRRHEYLVHEAEIAGVPAVADLKAILAKGFHTRDLPNVNEARQVFALRLMHTHPGCALDSWGKNYLGITPLAPVAPKVPQPVLVQPVPLIVSSKAPALTPRVEPVPLPAPLAVPKPIEAALPLLPRAEPLPAPVIPKTSHAPAPIAVAEVVAATEEIIARPRLADRARAWVDRLNPLGPLDLPKTAALQQSTFPPQLRARVVFRHEAEPHLPFVEIAPQADHLGPYDGWATLKAREATVQSHGANFVAGNARVLDAENIMAHARLVTAQSVIPVLAPKAPPAAPTAAELEAAGQLRLNIPEPIMPSSGIGHSVDVAKKGISKGVVGAAVVAAIGGTAWLFSKSHQQREDQRRSALTLDGNIIR